MVGTPQGTHQPQGIEGTLLGLWGAGVGLLLVGAQESRALGALVSWGRPLQVCQPGVVGVKGVQGRVPPFHLCARSYPGDLKEGSWQWDSEGGDSICDGLWGAGALREEGTPPTLLGGGGVSILPPRPATLLPVEGGGEPVRDHHHVAVNRGVARGHGLGAEWSGGAAVHIQRGSD